MFAHHRRLFNLALALTVTCGAQPAVFAATTGPEIVAGIDKQHILAPGARVNARVEGGNAFLSTYRHTKANDTDLKIDAMLMSKVVMDLDPGINNVTVYFFSSADLTKFKQVTVTSVSVKAFGSGAVGKDELIGSLNLTTGTTQDAAARLANTIAAAPTSFGRKVESAINGTEVSVSTELPPDASDRDLKYEALQLAEDALQAAPELKTVKVAFADLSSPGAYRQVVLDAGAVRALNTAVRNALSSVNVSVHAAPAATTAATGAAGNVLAGPMQEDRQKLLDRITTLGKNGVGVAPFLAAFQAIEQQIQANATVDTINEAVQRLSGNVDTQEKNYKEAKARKTTTTTTTVSTGGGAEPIMPKVRLDRLCAEIREILAAQLKNSPIEYVTTFEGEINARPDPVAKKIERTNRLYQYAIQQLISDPSKAGDVATLKRKLAAFQAQHPGVKFQ